MMTKKERRIFEAWQLSEHNVKEAASLFRRACLNRNRMRTEAMLCVSRGRRG